MSQLRQIACGVSENFNLVDNPYVQFDMTRIILWHVEQILQQLMDLLDLHGHVFDGNSPIKSDIVYLAVQSPLIAVCQLNGVEIHSEPEDIRRLTL